MYTHKSASVYNKKSAKNAFSFFTFTLITMSKPLEIKISTIVAVSVILHETEPTAIEKALQAMTGGTTDFFENEFAVIDVGNIDPVTSKLNWKKLVTLFKSYGLNTVAVRNAPEECHDKILKEGLSIDDMVKPQETQLELPVLTPEPEPVAVPPQPVEVVKPEPVIQIQKESIPAMIIDTPVRAGQRIYAKGTDLVVMASVNNGAEVIADGSIHIYAPLRGRALAGASGNTEARIFTTSLAAELVSIAGVYQTFDNGYPENAKQKPVQIKLNGEHIDISPLQLTV